MSYAENLQPPIIDRAVWPREPFQHVSTELFIPGTDPRPRLIEEQEDTLKGLHNQLFGDVIERQMGSLLLLSANKLVGIDPPEELTEEIEAGIDLDDEFERGIYLESQTGASSFFGDVASAKIVGIDVDIPDDVANYMLQKLHEKRDWSVKQLSGYNNPSSVPWRNILSFATIIGFNIGLTQDEQAQTTELLISKQRDLMQLYEDHRSGNIDEEYKDYSIESLARVPYWGLLNQLADARIAGVQTPLYQHTMDMGEKIVLMDRYLAPSKLNGYYPSHASNIAILSAREIKIGGPKGLELFF